ncbi:uncharacterized protein J7T54_007194 [Emericellopsis cladophorae]|uniref:Major facilitator superfamily (MFS) profile domain-containing protein n=1 Tax=Emericellopsis cladophorae TaxID=2686198 RepID=A0A9P9XV14_9HYPO|nr:uncharacterized protein J7T54_007194 [Emericellopsis cladophorae]KAI6778148.1 hypothetical protein J7T54_007194 [Emericellopsis cladophorae]
MSAQVPPTGSVPAPSVRDDKHSIAHVEASNDDGVWKHNGHAEAVDQFGAHKKTDPKEIALVKKLDRYMLPILWLMYFFNFLDRNAMINGRLNNLETDLGLVGSQYNTCVSILFVGYLCGQIPSNMILNRVRPSWYMSGFCMAWSIISLLTYKAHDFRTMLFYPGALYMISMFYTRKEVATRMAIFYTGNMLASSFSGLIAAGIFKGLDHKMGLAGWQWLFVVQGAVSILVSVIAFFTLPDSPLKTRWLNQEERELAHARIFTDQTGRREGTSVWTGLREATSDWRVWVFCLMDNFHLSANGFKNFLPTVIETLGYGRTATLALTCPPYLFAGGVSIAVSWSSGRFNERTWHATISKLVAIAGFALSVATLNVPARFVGIMLFVGATYGVNNIILGWTASVVGQTDEKKAVAIAMANTLGNLASVYTPYLWPSSDEPRYLTAMLASIAFSLGVIACAWVMRFSLQYQNRKLKERDPNATNFYVY